LPEESAAFLAALRALASADVLYNAAVAERLGVTATDLRCLSHLDEVGSATPGELARWSGLTSGAVTGVVDRLSAAGLVRREAHPTDARRVRVTPVPDQRADVEVLMAPLGRRLLVAAEELSAEQRDALLRFTALACEAMTQEAQRIRSGW